MPDGWEHYYSFPAGGCGLDPSDFSDQHGDADDDGSDNLREYNEDTDPCDDDSDDDGDPDGDDPPPVYGVSKGGHVRGPGEEQGPGPQPLMQPVKRIGVRVVITDDGRVHTGVVVKLNGDRMMLNTDLTAPNQQIAITRNQIEEITISKTSPMPLKSRLTSESTTAIIASSRRR